ncbi:MAG TPA: YqaA family protein [Burkholderiaceae bacterium]|nr:YqaA family protein [Burkholderiaceae bacterium]
METWLTLSIEWLLVTLALPRVGLSAIFVISLVSATLLPMGSEPAVFGYLKIAPHMFWPAVMVATLGNTLGGIITYFMGMGAEKAYEHWREDHPSARGKRAGGRWHDTVSAWINRMGPIILLFSWLPLVGDPLCAVAGWLRLPFWPSVFYMTAGKWLRYVIMTTTLLWVFPTIG